MPALVAHLQRLQPFAWRIGITTAHRLSRRLRTNPSLRLSFSPSATCLHGLAGSGSEADSSHAAVVSSSERRLSRAQYVAQASNKRSMKPFASLYMRRCLL